MYLNVLIWSGYYEMDLRTKYSDVESAVLNGGYSTM